MPIWEANKRKTWKVSGKGSWMSFAGNFKNIADKDINPYIKETFLRLLAENKNNRINQVEVNVSIRGRRLNKVV